MITRSEHTKESLLLRVKKALEGDALFVFISLEPGGETQLLSNVQECDVERFIWDRIGSNKQAKRIQNG